MINYGLISKQDRLVIGAFELGYRIMNANILILLE